MTETATLGGGCFWCLEAAFDRLEGIESVTSGYAGGHVADPSYRQVCEGTTGHAEVVRIVYDPATITFRDLLEVFFAMHDPTTPNRQGADVGPQFRSIILYESEGQRETAEAVIRELEADRGFSDPIVTDVEALDAFYRAEKEHQNFYRDHPSYGYCRVVIDPKLAKLREKFADRLKGSND